VPPNRGQHVAFRVDDVDAVVTRAARRRRRGGEPETGGGHAIRQTFALDPDGNLVEFTQPA
jgi:catechol 2,3-dioxygenase-like lactoylglutathione lyase family enzyme